jgi:hypothetical protein
MLLKKRRERRQGRRLKQLLNRLKKTRKYRKLKEETLDRLFEEIDLEESMETYDRLSLNECL